MMALKNAHHETQLEVDLMILDYLLFESTQAVLDEANQERGSSEHLQRDPDLTLNLYHNFMPIFKCNHPDCSSLPQNVRFRHRLLYFSTTYCRRFQKHAFELGAPELESIRFMNQHRAVNWWEDSDDDYDGLPAIAAQSPPSPGTVERARRRLKANMKLDARHTAHVGSSDCTTLLDLLPAFMALTASLEESNVTEAWMRLAAEFMLQAVLEQYLLYGASGAAKMREAFAWGWRPVPSEDWQDELIVNDMFCEEGLLQEVEGWHEMRESAMRMLEPPEHTPLSNHLETLSGRFPISKFHRKLLGFLEALWQSQDEPLLTQVELGQIKGLSPAESERVKERCRWPM